MIGLALLIAIGMPLLLERSLLKRLSRFLHAKGMYRLNYRGEQVLTAGGLVIVFSAAMTASVLLAMYLLREAVPQAIVHGFLVTVGMSAMAFWGWLDDRASDCKTKGFRGHFGALYYERKVTSGMWKVFGGTSTALCVALFLSLSFGAGLVCFGLLTMSPNMLNLFDLRPARAIKVFWMLMLLAAACSVWTAQTSLSWIFLIPVMVVSIYLFSYDAGGQLMLGDTGANALGYVAGYSFVIGTPVYVQTSLLAIFICLQVAAEFCSFSRIIEQVGWLRRLDQWGRAAELEEKKDQTGSSGLV